EHGSRLVPETNHDDRFSIISIQLLAEENRESTFRVLSGPIDEEGSGDRGKQKESTFRVLPFDFFTCFNDEFWVKVELIFKILSTAESLIALVALQKSQHIEI